MPDPHTDPAHRHDFVLIFDVTDGNPNGDPDAGNLPRTDPETMQGLVSDVALKRKVRDFVTAIAQDETDPERKARLKIFIEHRGVLNETIERAYTEQGLTSGKHGGREDALKAQNWMCANFYDVRMFGALMTTGLNAGQVRGPLQLTFARSVDPVLPQDLAITRVAVADAKDNKTLTTMGRKTLIPYGLYVGYGFYSPHLAAGTGVDEYDLEVFWQALVKMWELDRSAARGLMAPHGLYVFTHDSKLGNAPSHQLFKRIQVNHRNGNGTPRAFEDYSVTVEEDDMPRGVRLTKLLQE